MPEVRVLVLATNAAFPISADREIGKGWRGVGNVPIPPKIEGSGLRELVARRQQGTDAPGMLFLGTPEGGTWPGGGSDAIAFALAALDAWVREEGGGTAALDLDLTGSALLSGGGFGAVEDIQRKQERLDTARGDRAVRYFQAPGPAHREGAIEVADMQAFVRAALPILCEAYDVPPRTRRWLQRQVDLTWPPRWRRRVVATIIAASGLAVATLLLGALVGRVLDDQTWAACVAAPTRECVGDYLDSRGRHYAEALEMRERKVYREARYVSAPIRVSAWGEDEEHARAALERRAQCGADETIAWEPNVSRTLGDGVVVERSYTCSGTRNLVEEPYAP